MADKPTVVQMTDHPWCAIDLDGCLMEENHYPNFGPPRIGAKDAVDHLVGLGLKIMVFTARTHLSGLDGKFQNVNRVVNEIYEWGRVNLIKIDYVWPLPKPASIVCFFDDRAIRVHPREPNSESLEVKSAWDLAIKQFDLFYKPQLSNWLREVTPQSFAVEGEDGR